MNTPNTHFWYGTVTLETIDGIAQAIRDLLTGRRYTFVGVNDYFGPTHPPDVHVSQVLDTVTVYREEIEGHPYGWIFLHDTYGVYTISSDCGADNQPYVSFRDGQLTVVQKSGSGNQLVWVFAPEQEKEETVPPVQFLREGRIR